ncbi:MAG: MBL fold metallo-hydrolase [Deltaproteobacteria bacterium]|nr:MAG: MBL fold metallo-hydrolase [Deltaproteobacteria bacterium]
MESIGKNLFFSVLGSGSRGNSVFVKSPEAKILFDAGLSGREIEKRLDLIGESPEELTALVVSHEHSDHIKGIGVLSRRYNLPVYANEKTHEASASDVKKLFETRFFNSGNPFDLNDITIHPFSISHDAEDPCGFTIQYCKSKLGLATDLGVATALVKTRLKDCTGIVLEANHDPALLASGSYPWALKQRIKSRVGHLSNQDARDLIGEIVSEKLKNIVLGHISNENNCHEKALSTVSEALKDVDLKLVSALQDEPTSVFSI